MRSVSPTSRWCRSSSEPARSASDTALGATRGEITLQFLAESGATGLMGGVLGTLIGLSVVVVAALIRRWNPIIDASIPLAAPAVGLVVGLIAGIYPAIRAARLQPVDALRST
ncbi:MAG: ABC transporter permease [Microthrixaceae bacterium]